MSDIPWFDLILTQLSKRVIETSRGHSGRDTVRDPLYCHLLYPFQDESKIASLQSVLFFFSRFTRFIQIYLSISIYDHLFCFVR